MPGCRRVSNALRKEDVLSLTKARSFARSIGKPLDHVITIHWGCAGGPGDGGSSDRQARLFRNVRDWMRRRGVPFMHIWTLEATNKETHLHGMIHVPEGFLKTLEGYLRGQLRGSIEVLDLKKAVEDDGGETGWFRYMIKGCDKDVRSIWCPPNKGPQGTINGKRCGFSTNIGPTARGRVEDSV
jgi:hypothetical protein